MDNEVVQGVYALENGDTISFYVVSLRDREPENSAVLDSSIRGQYYLARLALESTSVSIELVFDALESAGVAGWRKGKKAREYRDLEGVSDLVTQFLDDESSDDD